MAKFRLISFLRVQGTEEEGAGGQENKAGGYQGWAEARGVFQELGFWGVDRLKPVWPINNRLQVTNLPYNIEVG
jgi:hypothetical protein